MTSNNTPKEISADADVGITFAELGLHPKIIKALDDMGYERPTPIQAHAIPHALQGKDVLGIAQTGTGKTGAFTLPTVHKLATGRARARMPRCLIICPTRELAAQVAENVELYGKYLKLEMALLIGGVSFAEQDKKLSRGVDVLIATPGRLLDQFERGKILLNGVQTLVVDEADRMLDMGFIPDIEKIFKMTPFTRQVLFFSATMPNEIKRLVEQFLHQPETIQVARKNMTAKTVTQRIVRLPKSDAKLKRTALRWIIENEKVKNGIVFCNRKRDVDIVAKSLSKHGHSAAPIHGDLPQSQRTQTLADFKEGRVKLLVASDVAARGLDVPSVSHVFNYDVPGHAEDYVHRIGRTGRAGRKGDTVMLVGRLDEKNYDAILHMIKVDGIDELEIPGIEDFPTEGKARRGGQRDRGRGSSGNRGRGDRNRGGGGRNRSNSGHSHGNSERARPAPSKSTPAKSAPEDDAPKPKRPVRDASRTRKAPAGRKKVETDNSAPAAPEAPAPSKVPAPNENGRTRKAPPGRRKAPEGRKRAEAKTESKAETQSDHAPEPPNKEKSKSHRAAPTRAAKEPHDNHDDHNDKQAREDRPKKSERRDSKSESRSKSAKGERGRGRDNSGSRAKPSRSREDAAKENDRANKKRSRKRDHDKGQKEDFAGFGSDVPAFFKNPLK